MSAEAIPAVQAAVQPEAVPVPETPLERFASHVEWVREQGDAFDTRPALWPVRLSKAGAVTGVVGGLTTGMGVEFATMATEATGAVAVAGLAAWGMNRLRESRVRDAAIRRLDAGTGLLLNQRYELVRVNKGITKKADIVMLWHGPTNDPVFHKEDQQKTVAEALQEMAGMAEKCGVHSIAMSPELEAAATSDSDSKLPEMTVTQFLETTKRLHTAGRTDKEKVVSASPAHWVQHARNKVEYDQGAGVDAMLTQLESLDYRHAAVRLGREYAADREWQRTKVKASLKGVLEMQMGEAGIAGAPDRHTPENFVRHDKQQGVALIDGEDVAIFVNGRLTERTPIMQKLGLTEERLGLLLQSKNPALRRERQEALEFALYRTLHRQDDAQAVEGRMGREVRDIPIMPKVHRYQVDLAVRKKTETGEKTSRWPQRRRALGIAAGAALVTAVISGSGMIFGDAKYSEAHTAAAVQLAREHGFASAHDVPEKQIRQRMDEWSGVNTAWGEWKGLRTDLHRAIWDHHKPADPNAVQRQAGFGNARSAVGNFGPHNPTPVWNLEPHNMSTEGMYVSETWQTAVICPPSRLTEICSGGNATWTNDVDGMVKDEIKQMPTDVSSDRAADPTAKWIHASGTVYRSDFEVGSLDAFMGLPMLPRSDIFAASFNGQPVKLVGRQDGTVAIELQNPDQVMASGAAKVDYWFQPDESAYNIHQYVDKNQDRITAGTTFYEYNPHREALLSRELAVPGIDDVFKQYIPGYDPKASPDEKRLAVYDYLKYDFLYTLNPISADEAKQITDWKTFAANVLQRKIANCNVATIILALADPRLSAASGFANSAGEGSNVLTRDEAHIVDLYQDQLIDAVPTGQFELSTPGSDKPPQPLSPWILLAAAMQLGGAVLLTQRQAREMLARQKAVHQMKAANRAEQKLQAMGPFVLNLAADAAGAAAWSPDGKADLEYAAYQAADKTALGYDAARVRVQDPVFRDPGTLKRLKQQPWKAPIIRQVHRQANIAAKRPPHHRLRK
jgi:hypothetical protein